MRRERKRGGEDERKPGEERKRRGEERRGEERRGQREGGISVVLGGSARCSFDVSSKRHTHTPMHIHTHLCTLKHTYTQ